MNGRGEILGKHPRRNDWEKWLKKNFGKQDWEEWKERLRGMIGKNV